MESVLAQGEPSGNRLIGCGVQVEAGQAEPATIEEQDSGSPQCPDDTWPARGELAHHQTATGRLPSATRPGGQRLWPAQR